MIITKIKKSKKGNILIYADNNYLISISPEVFFKSNLKIGSYIEESDIAKLTESTDVYKANKKALDLLSFRAHSRKELENKIKRSLGEDCALKAADKMEKLGLINDKKFAFDYANELFYRKLYSIKRVKFELSKKGIKSDIISEVVEEIDPDENEILKKVIEKKYLNNGKNLNEEKELKRAISYCQRLGYGWSLIKSTLNLFD